MKNPNGYGSVYKLTGKRRRPWVARVTKEYTDEGEQIREIIGYYKEQADAILALANYHNEPITPKADITLKELYEEWSAIKYESISKSRTNGYKQGWNYLCKYENVKFKELRTSQLQSCLKDKKRDTANNIKIVANMLYKYAMENDIINKNYAAFLQLPRKSKEEKSIFTDIEIQKIEKNAGKIEWLDTVLILIYTGLRITEFLTLTKFNIDLKAKTITGGIKSDAGKNRVIPIHSKIYKYIKKWHDKGFDNLITHNDGKTIPDKHFREKYYYAALESAGVSKLNPHCCRHTFASLMAKAGADTIAIQKIMGHSDYALTANTYTHTNVDDLKKAINLI